MISTTFGDSNKYSYGNSVTKTTSSYPEGSLTFSGQKTRKGKVLSSDPNTSRMELLISANSFSYPQKKSDRVQRTLNYMGKIFTKDNLQTTGFRNRPILNLNRGEFDFTPKNLVNPSCTRRVLVTAPSKRKHYSFFGEKKKKTLFENKRDNTTYNFIRALSKK